MNTNMNASFTKVFEYKYEYFWKVFEYIYEYFWKVFEYIDK